MPAFDPIEIPAEVKGSKFNLKTAANDKAAAAKKKQTTAKTAVTAAKPKEEKLPIEVPTYVSIALCLSIWRMTKLCQICAKIVVKFL